MRRATRDLVLALLVTVGSAWCVEAAHPVPADAEQASRLRTLKDIYKDEYLRRTPEERAAFARRLLEQGLATSDDPVARFVFLREAQELAAKIPDLGIGEAAIAALADGYGLSAGEELLRFYAAATPVVGNVEAAWALLDAVLGVAAQAIAADDYPLAVRAATQAESFARRLRDAAALARAQEALDQARVLAGEFATLGALTDLLGAYTPAGHARYGRFVCFAKGDWEAGLEHLAAGDDAVLATLAARELAAVSDDERATSADAWFEWGQKQKAKIRNAALAHAGDLYRRALPGLSGLTHARADKRLAEIEKICGRPAPRYPPGAVLLMTFEPATIDGDVAWDQGPHRHQAQLAGATPTRGPWGGALAFSGNRDKASVANHVSLQTAASSTLMMWLRPDKLGARRNPWHKSYGAEGTWTLEPDGLVNSYYGTAGADAEPYAATTMPVALTVGVWVHLALVRDLASKQVSWYRDGALVASEAAKYPQATASTNPVTIGSGYVGAYVGLIDEVALWPRALTAKEVAAVYAATAPGRK